MDIATLWITRKGQEDAAPELICAWDGYSIEENWEGWEEACRKALEDCEPDVSQKRFINIHVNSGLIQEIFVEMKTVPAERVTELDDPSAI